MASTLSGVISVDYYDRGVQHKFTVYNIIVAMAKAFTFSFILSSIPAYFGFYVRGGALEIGRATTRAVIVSCIMILVADYELAALLL